MECLRIVVVGHVDHGKSSFVGRIISDAKLTHNMLVGTLQSNRCERDNTDLAYLLDSLQEEREQRMTIETCQVHVFINGQSYIFIDSPGHKEFAKNMITGAAQADMSVIIVDAKLGMESETLRHVNVLSFVGIKEIMIVINKMDTVNFEKDIFETRKKEITEMVSGLNMNVLACVPCSAQTGDNIVYAGVHMPWYAGMTFIESLQACKKKKRDLEMGVILPIQDVYKIEDKEMFVGRIERGTLQCGDDVWLFPDAIKTRILHVEQWKQKRKDTAYEGENVGFTVQDEPKISRGTIIATNSDDIFLSSEFEAYIISMSESPLLAGHAYSLHCVTQEVACSIKSIKKCIETEHLTIVSHENSYMNYLEIGNVIIATKTPIAVNRYVRNRELGRFVLSADGRIQAGGIIFSC